MGFLIADKKMYQHNALDTRKRRLAFVSSALLAAVLLLRLAFAATATGAGPTIAVIRSDSVLPYDEVLTGFKAGMLQRKTGQENFVPIENAHDQEALAAHIARIRPDFVLCLGSKALDQAARIDGIPKIFTLITQSGIQPWMGRNDILGVTLDLAPALQFRIIRQAFPRSRRIGVLYDPKHNQKIIEEAKGAAPTAGFQLQAFPISAVREIPPAYEKLATNNDLLWTLYDPTVYSPESATYVLMQSLRNRIPIIGFSSQFAKAGAPLALYGDYQDMGRQACLQAMAVLAGETNVVRIIPPRTVRIAINEKVGRFMGIDFSPQFLKTVHQTY